MRYHNKKRCEGKCPICSSGLIKDVINQEELFLCECCQNIFYYDQNEEIFKIRQI